MFDLPEVPTASINSEKVSRLMQDLDVFINVRHKPKQNTLSVVVKGTERNASNIYEARRELLGLSEPSVKANIPDTYKVPNTTSFLLQSTSTSVGLMNNPIAINGKIFCLWKISTKLFSLDLLPENLSNIGVKTSTSPTYAKSLANGPSSYPPQTNSMAYRPYGCTPAPPPGFRALHHSLDFPLQMNLQQMSQPQSQLYTQPFSRGSTMDSMFNNAMCQFNNSNSSSRSVFLDSKDSGK